MSEIITVEPDLRRAQLQGLVRGTELPLPLVGSMAAFVDLSDFHHLSMRAGSANKNDFGRNDLTDKLTSVHRNIDGSRRAGVSIHAAAHPVPCFH